jgi:hypothetical protein
MATQYSNKPIVTDGLVYALDFGNPKSYVSGSTTANSLIYIPTTASVSSSGLDSQGFLDLENSNFVSTNQLYNLGYTSGYTMIYTVDPKGNEAGTETNRITQGGSINTQRFWTGISSTRVSHWFLPDTSVNSTSAYTGRRFPITPGKQHIAIRYSSGSYSLFRNGIPVTSSAGPSIGSLSAGGNLSIGSTSYSGMTGSFAQFQVYNRPLTSDEIWNNYQLTAPRYGLGPLQNKPYNLDENAYLFLQSTGITDPIITGSIDTFVRGLKANNLWDKMIAIYPFVGTGSDGVNLTGSQSWNLKEPTTAFYKLAYNGAWEGSTSGSAPSGSNTYINSGINPKSPHPYFLNNNAHISILSYDTPASSSYLMGTGMTEELAISTLAGDYGTPAAAYSVRKVRTAYSGALMDVRRSIDNVTSSIGFVSNGDLDTGSLLDWVVPGRNDLPGEYEGLAAAYSLRRVSSSYNGDAIEVRRDWDNESGSFGFDANGDLDTVSLLTFVTGSAGTGSGFVQTWYDQSGNGRHATQTTASSQPLIVSAGSLITENGRPAINFSQARSTYLENSEAWTYDTGLVLTRFYTRPLRVSLLRNVTNTSKTIGDVAGESFRLFNGVNFYSGVVPSLSTQVLIYGLFDGANSEIAINGASSTVGDSGTSTGTGLRIGIGSITDAQSALNGTLQEITLYTSNQSTNRPLIENNINNYYNIYTGSNHGFVARWYDQSGNNRHATQTATGSQPLIVESGSLILEPTSSKPGLKFDGINDGLDTTTVVTTNPLALIMTANLLDINGNQMLSRVSDRTQNWVYFGWNQNGNQITDWYGPTSKTTPAFTGQRLYSFYTDATNGTFYQNHISTNSSSVFNSTSDSITIGQYKDKQQSINGYIQEYTIYNSDQSNNRGPIEYNINNYYNIYPQTSSFTTSSFTIKADPTSISGSLNNKLTSGIQSSGPLGLVTVSRTGSNSLTIARNGSTTSFSVPASGALSTGLYLGAVNDRGTARGSSPLNIEYASIGTGLTNTEISNYAPLVYNLRNNFKGYDRDAVTFINALGTAKSYLTLTQQSAINVLVNNLKSANLWDKFQVMYPFIGGTATSHGFNLKDPRQISDAHYMTFVNGVNNDLGYTAAGGQYGILNYNPSKDLLNISSSHISVYVPVLSTADGYDMGGTPFAANGFGFALRMPFSQHWFNLAGAGITRSGTVTSRTAYGYMLGSRRESNLELFYYTGSQEVLTSTTSNIYGVQDRNLTVGGSIRTYSFLTIGSGLTTSEVRNLNTIVQTYQAALGRQAI